MNSLSKQQILGVNITNASRRQVLEYIDELVKGVNETQYIVTPNPEMIVLAQTDHRFKSVLNNAGLAVCDGMGLLWAGRVLGKPIRERISGTDLVKDVCEKYAKGNASIGFLGAKPGIAELASERLRVRYPKLKIVYVDSGNPDDQSAVDIKNLKEQIDILFVAFGFPKQEVWMCEHQQDFPVRVMLGVGGAFDYISGKVLRAPLFIRSLGLEWLFRLFRQPWRVRRQLALPVFVWLVINAVFKK